MIRVLLAALVAVLLSAASAAAKVYFKAPPKAPTEMTAPIGEMVIGPPPKTRAKRR